MAHQQLLGIAMPDDTFYAVGNLGERIDLDDFYDLRYWSHRFGTAKWRIREAVLSVGDSADAVQEYLARGNPRRAPLRRVVPFALPDHRRF